MISPLSMTPGHRHNADTNRTHRNLAQKSANAPYTILLPITVNVFAPKIPIKPRFSLHIARYRASPDTLAPRRYLAYSSIRAATRAYRLAAIRPAKSNYRWIYPHLMVNAKPIRWATPERYRLKTYIYHTGIELCPFGRAYFQYP